MRHSPVTVVAASDDTLRPKLLDALLDDGSYDIVFVESIARAYSRTRQLHPDVVLVYMRVDDEGACRLLSMIEIDPDLHGTRLVTWASDGHECDSDPIAPESAPGLSHRVEAITTH